MSLLERAKLLAVILEELDSRKIIKKEHIDLSYFIIVK